MVGSRDGMAKFFVSCLAFLGIASQLFYAHAVDRSKFRTCAEASFCRRHRGHTGEKYIVKADTVKEGNGLVTAEVANEHAITFLLEIYLYDNQVARAKIKEKNPIRRRWEAPDVLLPDNLKPSTFRLLQGNDISLPSGLRAGSYDRVILYEENSAAKPAVAMKFNPFRLDYFVNGELGVTTNARNMFYFEHYRERSKVAAEKDAAEDKLVENKGALPEKEIVDYGEDGKAIYADGTVESPTKEESIGTVIDEESGVWEENFGGHADSKPYGPASVGVDIDFPSSSHLYGIPEHAERMALKTTTGEGAEYEEPYRMYNLDVFEYELYVPMALYGAIPFMLGHSTKRTLGIFWLNPTDTYVDISRSVEGGMQSQWVSESGIFDLFYVPGPRPEDVFRQYSSLTGTTPVPPIFSLGYHQCRWNYKDEKDVAQVNQGFEDHNIPYDVLWLDIEHTDGKRYYTWDNHLFPHPEQMQRNLSELGRKMVTIVDPHIKRDDNYYVHKEATQLGLYIKDKDGKDFDGWCWPGSSSYLDFTSAEVRQWWSKQFGYDKYKGSTPSLYTWNDMNEPSVFNGPEVSMPRDCKNREGVEHRDWHNLYGHYMHRATSEGLVMRNADKDTRPFVLSRSFFAGSQRFGAIWTGDNEAKWDHLEVAAPMLLSMNIAGLPFIGADVGGFFGNPNTELLVRWYQAGAYQPFFRGHAHHDAKRREPWLFGEPTTSQIRKAILARYALLPYWYTLFANHEKTGMPVMRPLWVHYPEEKETLDLDDQWLVGRDLLVKPVTKEGVKEAEIYLPGGARELWYDAETMDVLEGGRRVTVAAALEHIPVFQRGGSIIARKQRVRRSTKQMFGDPYTLWVALDGKKEAEGELYLDDEQSFKYQQGEFRRRKLSFVDNKLQSSRLDGGKKFAPDNLIERVIIGGLGRAPSKVINSDNIGLDAEYLVESDALIIRKPLIKAAYDWTITLHFN